MAQANRILVFIVLGLTALCAAYLLGGVKWLPWDLRPGSPVGQSGNLRRVSVTGGIVLRSLAPFG